MIDDLFTDLTIGAVDRLLSPETPRDEADFGLANLNARLSPPPAEDRHVGRERPIDGSAIERHLLIQYLQLDVDDLERIPAQVHEWVLDRLSSVPDLNEGASRTLRALYALFPDTTVRCAAVGLLIQSGGVIAIAETILQGEGLSPNDRSYQMQVLMDLALDYLDSLPDATLRALETLFDRMPGDERLTRHLLNWSERLGGERGARVLLVLGRDRHR
jgi:hypothetical protein